MTEKEMEQMTDEELIDCLRDGDNRVADYLCEKYKNLVRKEANSMFILGADHEDLIQEGMIGLYKAVRDYNAQRGSSFKSFAELCVNRKMISAIKTASYSIQSKLKIASSSNPAGSYSNKNNLHFFYTDIF